MEDCKRFLNSWIALRLEDDTKWIGVLSDIDLLSSVVVLHKGGFDTRNNNETLEQAALLVRPRDKVNCYSSANCLNVSAFHSSRSHDGPWDH